MTSIEPSTTEPGTTRQRAWKALSHRSDQICQALSVIRYFTLPQHNRRSGQERRTGVENHIMMDRRSGQQRRVPLSQRLQVLQHELQELMHYQDTLRLLQPMMAAT